MAEAFAAKQSAVNFLMSKYLMIKECSINFLLEEAAMFNSLIMLGYNIDVYPGRHVEALNQLIIDREFNDDVPKGLKERIVVELTIHRIGQSSKTVKI